MIRAMSFESLKARFKRQGVVHDDLRPKFCAPGTVIRVKVGRHLLYFERNGAGTYQMHCQTRLNAHVGEGSYPRVTVHALAKGQPLHTSLFTSHAPVERIETLN